MATGGSGLPDLGAEGSELLRACEERIGYTFTDRSLLQAALTHASGAQHRLASNERLEFLGDAVLELAVTEFLYAKYPDKPEGELTAFRAALVNTQSISDAAVTLGMNEFLLLSRGEAKDTFSPPTRISPASGV